MRTPSHPARRRGSALLAVLWLSAALAAIAFALANRVRAELEHTSAFADGARAEYLAAGAIDRAILWILRGPGPRRPDGSPTYYEPPMPFVTMDFPSGMAVVEVIPEMARLNINAATPQDLERLALAAGADPERAKAIVGGILDWRSPAPGPTRFDQEYLRRIPSFAARHASFEEIEELLNVYGMTPELFYGSYVEDLQGRLVARGGMKDSLSIWGSTTSFDVNTASGVLLESIGIPPAAVSEIIKRRRIRPFRNAGEVQAIAPGAGRLHVGGNVIWTLRATARLKTPAGLSESARSVSATVKFLKPEQYNPPYHVLRWNSDAWSSDAARPLTPAEFDGLLRSMVAR